MTLLLVLFTIILIIDQSLKIWVKLNFHLGEQHLIFSLNWARLHLVENESLAFGLAAGEEKGKVALAVLNLIAIAFIGWVLYRFYTEKSSLAFSFLWFSSLLELWTTFWTLFFMGFCFPPVHITVGLQNGCSRVVVMLRFSQASSVAE
nr:signal peptidase II [Saprospiraceae bacterium]